MRKISDEDSINIARIEEFPVLIVKECNNSLIQSTELKNEHTDIIMKVTNMKIEAT